MAWSWSPGDHWLAGSLPGLLGTYPGQGPWIQDSWISISPNRFRGLWDAVGGLFLRIRSLLPTEQLAAGQGWLRNLSVTAKLSFTALTLLWGCESGEDLKGRLQQWEVWGDTLKRPLGAAITFHAVSFCVSLDSVTKQGAREQWFYHCPVAICWSWTCFATVYSPPRLNISHPVPLNW